MNFLLYAVLVAAPWQHPKPHPKRARKAVHHAAPKPETMSGQRAAEIQQALIGAGYLKVASGQWDAATAAAMKKYQADHHWQTRFAPDARALLALGLVHPAASTAVASNGGGKPQP
ncbi:MAG: peptidoglycan-binding domain-containing protein [Terriglobales bacterium]